MCPLCMQKNWTSLHNEQIGGSGGSDQGREWGKDGLGIQSQQRQTVPDRMGKQHGPTVSSRELYSISHDKL